MGIWFPGTMHPRDMVALAREAEEAGFYSISVGGGVHDIFAALGAIAAVTQRVRLVSSVATWVRTPVTTAKACRTLAQLSDGRFVFGLGSMPRRWNEDHHGIPGEAPLARMREFVELVRILWAATPDTPVHYEGRFYRVSGYRAQEPPPQPRLPIFIGASRPKMIQGTGEWADGILVNWNYTIPWLKEHGLPMLADGAGRSGRSLDDLEVVGMRHIFVTDGPGQAERARAAFRRNLAATYLGIDYHQELLTSHGFAGEVATAVSALARGDLEGAAAAVSDRMVETFAIIGTADECAEEVSRYTSLLSWFSLLSTPTDWWPQADRVGAVHRLIRTFGKGSPA